MRECLLSGSTDTSLHCTRFGRNASLGTGQALESVVENLHNFCLENNQLFFLGEKQSTGGGVPNEALGLGRSHAYQYVVGQVGPVFTDGRAYTLLSHRPKTVLRSQPKELAEMNLLNEACPDKTCPDRFDC